MYNGQFIFFNSIGTLEDYTNFTCPRILNVTQGVYYIGYLLEVCDQAPITSLIWGLCR